MANIKGYAKYTERPYGTECTTKAVEFHGLSARGEVTVKFDGGSK